MKIIQITISLVLLGVSCRGEQGAGPYPPSGSRPAGALLLLPQRYTAAQPAPFTATQTELVRSVSLERLGEEIGARLEGEGGSRGELEVRLSDGRLHRLSYTSAPLHQQRPSAAGGEYPAFRPQLNFQNSQAFGQSGFQVSQQAAQATGGRLQEADTGYRSRDQAFFRPYTPATRPAQQQASNFQRQEEQDEGREGYERSRYSEAETRNAYRQYSQTGSPKYRGESSRLTGSRVPTGDRAASRSSNRDSQQRYAQAQDAARGEGEAASEQVDEQLPSSPKQTPATGDSRLSPAAPPSLADPSQTVQLATPALQPLQLHTVWPPTAESYFAQVQFTQLQPIAAPIYTAAPLVRILRDAPKY